MKALYSIGLSVLFMTVFSFTAQARCSTSHQYSHEIENGTANPIKYIAYVSDVSTPCGTTYTITGSLSPCSQVCLIPTGVDDAVHGVEIISDTHHIYDGNACYNTSGYGLSTFARTCGLGLPITATITYNGFAGGTVFEL